MKILSDSHPPTVGVFDSGVGGLTVLRALISEMPSQDFLYLGDTARLPYGTKSSQTVTRYALQAADTLVSHGVQALVVACNTAASVGLAAIRDRYGTLPVIGVIEAGAQAACEASISGNIAVIATERTIQEGAYERALKRRRPEARVTSRAAGLFVSLAEEGISAGPIAESIARYYLEDLLRTQDSPAPDTLLLGCTHFPMLIETITAVAGPSITIVDSATTTARAARRELSDWSSSDIQGSVRFLATDGAERFARLGSRFLDRAIRPHEIALIDL